ncbi:MAG: histidine kinase, partial [Ginsengibacter sp.]
LNLFSTHVVLWKSILILVAGKYFIIVIFEMIYTYLIVYKYLPQYISGKKTNVFISSIVAYTITCYILMGFCIFWYQGFITLPVKDLLLPAWHYTGLFISAGPPVACCLFIAVKMLKNYYEKMEEKLILVKENADAEIRLLKGQVHPHFLFNTLNNIYSLTLKRSPLAADMIQKLFNIVSYMINECSSAMVPLGNELDMIKDYMALENVRYGGRLDMQVQIIGNSLGKEILPLLMIPFVENSFKHGASKMLNDPWVKLNISIEERFLYFDLCNNKPAVDSHEQPQGIGLRNVQKRLQLLYPGGHLLKIEHGLENFSVFMKVPLEDGVRMGIKDEKQETVFV